MWFHDCRSMWERQQIHIILIYAHILVLYFLPHAFLETKRFRDYVVSIRVSFWVSFLAFGRPGEGKEKVRIKQHPILWMAAKTMKYLMHSKDCTQTLTNFISKRCKVSLAVVHYISFHGFGPLGRQKSTQMKISASTFLPASQFNLFN